MVTRIIVAIILGAIIGLQRQSDGNPAGFRTHMLICLGAAMFTILSLDFPGTTDTSRIAAGIVTGIGFLGAGAIFRGEDKVRGLTTAADLWAVTAIGIAVGIGYYVVAIVSTLLVGAILLLKKLTGGKV
ncbi:MAG TPA: MgtC/SapB family protein [Candidatus Diapherotrites archaeon]|uniref:MgtC/SapB family protein n=1 Tax=Candidatus Iainarchaeum sp. TaxID=3101447 RepID=A0A7J4IWH2_9ARCH|nr:MgtC/SapB family protein [Candidatus Diapherotrites archaeon]